MQANHTFDSSCNYNSIKVNIVDDIIVMSSLQLLQSIIFNYNHNYVQHESWLRIYTTKLLHKENTSFHQHIIFSAKTQPQILISMLNNYIRRTFVHQLRLFCFSFTFFLLWACSWSSLKLYHCNNTFHFNQYLCFHMMLLFFWQCRQIAKYIWMVEARTIVWWKWNRLLCLPLIVMTNDPFH